MDLSSLELTDGTYSIPVLLTDSHGNTYTETVSVALDIDTNEEQVVEGDNYVPVNEEIAEFIQEISGLEDGETVSLIVYGETIPEVFVAEEVPTEISESINFIEINISSGNVGTYQINFTVPSTYDADLIQAYVYEAGAWVQLDTTYVSTSGGNHNFYFITSHFSQFMIGEKTEETDTPSSSSSSNSCDTYWVCSSWSGCLNDLQTRECEKEVSNCDAIDSMPFESRTCTIQETGENEIINTGEPEENGEEEGIFLLLTGAVIGALGPTGAIFIILAFVLALILIFIFTRSRKLKKKAIEEEKKKKEEADKKLKEEEKVKAVKKKVVKKKKKPKKKKAKKKKAKKKTSSKKKVKKK